MANHPSLARLNDDISMRKNKIKSKIMKLTFYFKVVSFQYVFEKCPPLSDGLNLSNLPSKLMTGFMLFLSVFALINSVWPSNPFT